MSDGRAGGYDEGPASPAPVGELGYAEAAAELEAIIGELDQGLVDVDHLELRFRRAIEIVEELDRRIHRAKDEVDALMPRLGALGPAAGNGRPGAPDRRLAEEPEVD